MSFFVKKVVLKIIPSFLSLKNYFNDMLDILELLELPLYWITPAGMKIQMSDQIFLRKQIKNKFLKNSNPITIMIPTENINYKDIKIGLMPNLIHSMDGANIHLLIHYIKLLNIDLNLYTIHDCFAGDYLNMNLLENLVKKSFIDLYFKKDYLIQLDNNLKSQIVLRLQFIKIIQIQHLFIWS
uniref:RNA polymerase n=1 Tax=Armillaria sinapina TaxID=64372 RepID=A0A4D6FFD1_9AGAR|nr:RNA polymerase [Armillaria sinapina]QCB16361.1 RNA polymerase [Armillaria sinapina]